MRGVAILIMLLTIGTYTNVFAGEITTRREYGYVIYFEQDETYFSVNLSKINLTNIGGHEYTYDNDMIYSLSNSIAGILYTPPIDAKVLSYTNETKSFDITESRKGFEVDVDALSSLIKEKVDFLISKDNNIKYSHIDIPIIELEPTTNENNIVQFESIGTYTTYTAANDNRNTNIMIASEIINGTRLNPNEVFSWNNVIGDTTADKGYKLAGVIVNKKMDSGFGGGICQVSGTLYAATKIAGLTTVERKPHSVSVGYIPVMYEATIAYPYIDLKFRNDFEYPVYIHIDYDGKTLTVNIDRLE